MIPVDTNLPVYALRAESLLHAQAAASMRRLAEGAEPWGIPVWSLATINPLV